MAQYRNLCMFCTNTANSREHIWPKWIQRYRSKSDETHSNHTTAHGIGGSVAERSVRKGKMYRPGNGLDQKLRVVCANCNNGWMSEIEKSVAPIISACLVHPKNYPDMTEENLEKILRWSYLRFLILTKLHNYEGDWELGKMPKKLFGSSNASLRLRSLTFAQTQSLPANLRIHLLRTADVDWGPGSYNHLAGGTIRHNLYGHPEYIFDETMIFSMLGISFLLEHRDLRNFSDLQQNRHYALCAAELHPARDMREPSHHIMRNEIESILTTAVPRLKNRVMLNEAISRPS